MKRLLTLIVAATLALALSACGSSSGSSADDTGSHSSADSSPAATTPPEPTLTACDLLAPAQVEKVLGVKNVKPTSVAFQTVPGMGTFDSCGFGDQPDTYWATVSLGTKPAKASALPKSAQKLPGVGDAATYTGGQANEVAIIKGNTLAKVAVPNFDSNAKYVPAVKQLARDVAKKMPASPPAHVGIESKPACSGLDTAVVQKFMGGKLIGSRSLSFSKGARICAWLTRKDNAYMAVSHDKQVAQNIISQKDYANSRKIKGVGTEAYALPGEYMAALPGGGVVYVFTTVGAPKGVGQAGDAASQGKPAPVTPKVVAFLKAVVTGSK